MSVFAWILVAYFAANALFAIGIVGKEREPWTPGQAVAAQFIYAGLIWAVLQSVGVL